MVLSYRRLKAFADEGFIKNIELEQIRGASIDVTLGSDIRVFERYPKAINLRRGEMPKTVPVDITEGYLLKPDEFILARTVEELKVPDNIAMQFQMRSSFGRIGINNLMAGWVDPCFEGTITLELHNVTWNSYEIYAGMRIGQLILHDVEPVPEEFSYKNKGKYNGQVSTQESKGL